MVEVTNRFKGLALIDRVPEELWTEACDIVQEAGIISKWGFNSTWTKNLQIFKLYLEKAEEPEIKLPTSAGSSKKQESSRKNLLLL